MFHPGGIRDSPDVVLWVHALARHHEGLISEV